MREVALKSGSFTAEKRVRRPSNQEVDVVLIGPGFEVAMTSGRSIRTTCPVNVFMYEGDNKEASAFVTTDPKGFESVFMQTYYPKPNPESDYTVIVTVRASSREEAESKVTIR